MLWDSKKQPAKDRKGSTLHVVRYKDVAWKRWRREYLIALQERHNMTQKKKKFKINLGDVASNGYRLVVIKTVTSISQRIVIQLKLATKKMESK